MNMKRILLLLFLGIFSANIMFVFSVNDATVEKCTTRKVILKGKDKVKGEVARTPVVYPVEVFIDGKVLYINVLKENTDFTVSIINVIGEENIYQGKTMDGMLTIDLNLEMDGSYRIELLSEDSELSGDFDLN